VDVFKLFFNRVFVAKIAEETDMPSSFLGGVNYPASHKPVTEEELYIVLDLFMPMGIIQKPTLRTYFITRRVISTPGFGGVITRDRFELICKFLHFTDDESFNYFQGPNKLFKIFPVMSHLCNGFQEKYLPNQDISTDESLTLWKGCLSFKQYLPLKASKFGIKTYKLCDATTGYLWSLFVYAGKDTELHSHLITEDTNKTTATGLKLVELLLKQGQSVWIDNFCNSPCLARTLKTAQDRLCRYNKTEQKMYQKNKI
jgi:hypothetical protein